MTPSPLVEQRSGQRRQLLRIEHSLLLRWVVLAQAPTDGTGRRGAATAG